MASASPAAAPGAASARTAPPATTLGRGFRQGKEGGGQGGGAEEVVASLNAPCVAYVCQRRASNTRPGGSRRRRSIRQRGKRRASGLSRGGRCRRHSSSRTRPHAATDDRRWRCRRQPRTADSWSRTKHNPPTRVRNSSRQNGCGKQQACGGPREGRKRWSARHLLDDIPTAAAPSPHGCCVGRRRSTSPTSADCNNSGGAWRRGRGRPWQNSARRRARYIRKRCRMRQISGIRSPWGMPGAAGDNPVGARRERGRHKFLSARALAPYAQKRRSSKKLVHRRGKSAKRASDTTTGRWHVSWRRAELGRTRCSAASVGPVSAPPRAAE